MTIYRITRIECQKRYPRRRSIFLDEAFAFGLDEEVVLRAHLHEGDEISDEAIQHIWIEEEIARAKKKALALLSYRMRSIQEIREALSSRGYEDKTVELVISDFQRAGLLNDTSFASAYIETRMIQRPAGKRLLIQELQHRGIDESLALRTVEEAYGERSETDLAFSLIQPRLSRMHDTPVKVLKKISDFLLRRGFGWEIIHEVLDRLRQNLESEE
jgi:regulatory protein